MKVKCIICKENLFWKCYKTLRATLLRVCSVSRLPESQVSRTRGSCSKVVYVPQLHLLSRGPVAYVTVTAGRAVLNVSEFEVLLSNERAAIKMDNSDNCSSVTWLRHPTGSAAFLRRKTKDGVKTLERCGEWKRVFTLQNCGTVSVMRSQIRSCFW